MKSVIYLLFEWKADSYGEPREIIHGFTSSESLAKKWERSDWNKNEIRDYRIVVERTSEEID